MVVMPFEAPNGSPPSPSSSASSLTEDLDALREAAKSGTLSTQLCLINGLRRQGELEELRVALRQACGNHLLPSTTWLDYLSDEIGLATTAPQRQHVLSLFEKAIQDFAVPQLHHHRLAFAATMLRSQEIDEGTYRKFLEDAKSCGAFYYTGVETADTTIVFEEPPQDYQVFEKRLSDTSPANAGTASEERVAAYLFYADFAESRPRFAISIYERALGEAFLSVDLWKRYHAFLSRMSHPSCPVVIERACRALPHHLNFWSLAVVEADADGLARIVENVKPYVMSSSDLSAACRLTKDLWSRYLSLGCPESLTAIMEGTLAFNIPESVEWASAYTHAAAVVAISELPERCTQLMEQVVAVRPEARWWLSYAGFMPTEKKRGIYEHALRSVGTVSEVSIVRDAWEAFEVSLGGEGLMERIKVIAGVASIRDAERLRVADPGEGRRSGKPAKRRRSEKSGKSGTERNDANKKKKEKSDSLKVKKGVDKMDEDTVTANGNDATKEIRDAKPNAESKRDGVEPRTVFLNNLSFSVSESDLREEFSYAGAIKQIRLPRRSDGASKGIAYIEFGDAEAVKNALAKHGKPIHGRGVWVRRSKPPAKKGVKERGAGRRVQRGRRRIVVDGSLRNAQEEDKKDGDVVMGDGEAERKSGLGQDDFRKMLLKDK